MGEIIAYVISAISLSIAVATYMRNGRKDIKTETREESSQLEGIREGLLKANIKLDQVCATTNETRADIKALNKDLAEMDKRIAVVERDVKTAFVRIDEIREQIKAE